MINNGLKKGDIVFVVRNGDVRRVIVEKVLADLEQSRILGIRANDDAVYISEYIFMTLDCAVESLNKRFDNSIKRQTREHENLINDIKERFLNG